MKKLFVSPPPRCKFCYDVKITANVTFKKAVIVRPLYTPVHYMYRAKFQLGQGQAVQYKYRLYEAKRDGTPN